MSGKALSPERDVTVENWKPKHDRVVILYLAGYQINTISDMVGYTREWVSDIIKDPKAQDRIETMRERIYSQVQDDITASLKMLGPQAVSNIKRTLIEDHKPGSKAKKHQDKMSFELLDRIGHGKSSGTEGGEGGGIKLEGEDVERLADALEKSDRAREEHEIDMEESGEGSFTPSENGGSDAEG